MILLREVFYLLFWSSPLGMSPSLLLQVPSVKAPGMLPAGLCAFIDTHNTGKSKPLSLQKSDFESRKRGQRAAAGNSAGL